VPEQRPIRNVTHKELDNHEVLVHRLVEAWSGLWRGSASDRLLEIGVGVGIVELYGLDTAKIVVVTRELSVTRGSGECRFGHELVGLVVQTVLDVAS
jgi:hypothetical protein